ncbi:MAG: hypothetical protein LBO65_02140 [Spirochaetaceae bacterium]|jgi:hypothetical protein|nr:hypothetical protein [Spirochaetaceae bacterium]
MNILKMVRDALQVGYNTLSGRILLHLGKPKKPLFPLADRLLADAFRLGQLPSPTEKEERRAVFVVERLKTLNLPYTVDEAGNILVRLYSLKEDPELREDVSSEPLLVFTRLVSTRWNPLESLGKLELQYARGAGLADALGPAALLSIAEAFTAGRLTLGRDILLFFSALHFDDPYTNVFRLFTSDRRFRPLAAIGVRGFMLGFLTSHTLGAYRVELTLTEEEEKNSGTNAVVSALIDTARHFQQVALSFGDALHIYFSRIEALSSFNRTPPEGVMELDMESADKKLLEEAVEKIRAIAENTAYRNVKGSFRIVSFIPPGDPSVSEGLTRILQDLMKELKINAEEEAKSDPASFLSAQGIPALSVGVASGREGLGRDTVEIASIEKGRQLLERLIMQAGT